MEYKNLNFNVNSHYQDILGDMDFEVDECDWVEFCEDNDNEIEYLSYMNETTVSVCQNRDGNKCGSYNADVFIVFMAWALEQDRDINIKYYGQNFWLGHDISHAVHDTSGGTIYPSAFAENRANEFSLNLLKEQNVHFDLSLEQCCEFAEAFEDRFNERCIINEDTYFDQLKGEEIEY